MDQGMCDPVSARTTDSWQEHTHTHTHTCRYFPPLRTYVHNMTIITRGRVLPKELRVTQKIKNCSNIYPTRCHITQFILSGNCSTCFGWYHHPSSGAHTSVSTASRICHTVTAICRYRGRVGTGFSVLWVATR